MIPIAIEPPYRVAAGSTDQWPLAEVRKNIGPAVPKDGFLLPKFPSLLYLTSSRQLRQEEVNRGVVLVQA